VELLGKAGTPNAPTWSFSKLNAGKWGSARGTQWTQSLPSCSCRLSIMLSLSMQAVAATVVAGVYLCLASPAAVLAVVPPPAL